MGDNKIIFHLEYDPDTELSKLVDAMHGFAAEELRLWIIQELANFGHERWPVIEIGTQVLKEKISKNPEKIGL